MRRTIAYAGMGAVATVAVAWAAVVLGGEPGQVPKDEHAAVPTSSQLASEDRTPAAAPIPAPVEVVIDQEVEDEQVEREHGERLEEIVLDLEDRHEALIAAGATEAAATVQAQIERLRELPPR